MRTTSPLQLALARVPSQTVTRADFDAAAHRLEIQIGFAAGSRFVCLTYGPDDLRETEASADSDFVVRAIATLGDFWASLFAWISDSSVWQCFRA